MQRGYCAHLGSAVCVGSILAHYIPRPLYPTRPTVGLGHAHTPHLPVPRCLRLLRTRFGRYPDYVWLRSLRLRLHGFLPRLRLGAYAVTRCRAAPPTTTWIWFTVDCYALCRAHYVPARLRSAHGRARGQLDFTGLRVTLIYRAFLHRMIHVCAVAWFARTDFAFTHTRLPR